VSENFGSGNVKRGHNLIDEGVDVTIILNSVWKNLLWAAWTGSAWHTIGITAGSGEHGN